MIALRRTRRGAAGPARYGEQLDCLIPNLQMMKISIHRKDARYRCHVLCRFKYTTGTTSGMRSDAQ